MVVLGVDGEVVIVAEEHVGGNLGHKVALDDSLEVADHGFELHVDVGIVLHEPPGDAAVDAQ